MGKLSGYSPKSSTMKLLHLLAGLAALVPVSVAESDGYFLCEEGLNYCGHTLSTMAYYNIPNPNSLYECTDKRTGFTDVFQITTCPNGCVNAGRWNSDYCR